MPDPYSFTSLIKRAINPKRVLQRTRNQVKDYQSGSL